VVTPVTPEWEARVFLPFIHPKIHSSDQQSPWRIYGRSLVSFWRGLQSKAGRLDWRILADIGPLYCVIAVIFGYVSIQEIDMAE
jgi:hypothetical protein